MSWERAAITSVRWEQSWAWPQHAEVIFAYQTTDSCIEMSFTDQVMNFIRHMVKKIKFCADHTGPVKKYWYKCARLKVRFQREGLWEKTEQGVTEVFFILSSYILDFSKSLHSFCWNFSAKQCPLCQSVTVSSFQSSVSLFDEPVTENKKQETLLEGAQCWMQYRIAYIVLKKHAQ